MSNEMMDELKRILGGALEELILQRDWKPPLFAACVAANGSVLFLKYYAPEGVGFRASGTHREPAALKGRQAENHEAEGHQAKGRQAENHEAERHQAEGCQAENHQVVRQARSTSANFDAG